MGLVAEFYQAPEVTDRAELDYLHRRIVLESAVFSNVSGLFTSILPKTRELISSMIPSLMMRGDNADIPFDLRSYQSVLRDVHKLNFVVYEDTLVTVPEGFHGKLIPFITTLLNNSNLLYRDVTNLLVEYEKELSVFLTHADARLSNKSNDLHFKKIKQSRESYERVIKPFFDKKYDGITRQKLGTIIDRFKDLEEVVKLTGRLKTAYTRKHYTEVQSKVQSVSDLMGLIHDRISEGEIQNYSPMMAKTLSEGAYELAKMVELYQIQGYLAEVTIGSVKAAGDVLKDLIGKR